jgi:hypothetical protein
MADTSGKPSSEKKRNERDHTAQRSGEGSSHREAAGNEHDAQKTSHTIVSLGNWRTPIALEQRMKNGVMRISGLLI